MKNKRRADFILILVLLVLSGSLFVVRFLSRSSGAVAAVYCDGKKTAEYPLSVDREVRLETEDGGYNVLVIRGGTANVTEADCPDKICVDTHPARYSGESITCLPNRLQVVIEGGESGVDL